MGINYQIGESKKNKKLIELSKKLEILGFLLFSRKNTTTTTTTTLP